MNFTTEWQPGMTLEQVEKKVILKAFRHFGGIQTATAHALGISVKTLYNKLQQYGMKGLDNDRAAVAPNGRSELVQNRRVDGFGRVTGTDAIDYNSAEAVRARAEASGGVAGEESGTERLDTGTAKEDSQLGQQESGANGEALSVQAETGNGSEPAVEVSAQQPVPVQQRQEVQTVLPKQNANGSAKSRRQG